MMAHEVLLRGRVASGNYDILNSSGNLHRLVIHLQFVLSLLEHLDAVSGMQNPDRLYRKFSSE
ncbi:MAG: hypothetical protein WA623_06335, partial [Candidatus Sulfotelmatobacter sp.]